MKNEMRPENSVSEQIRDLLTRTESFRTVAQVFSHLADPTRIRVFWLLCHTEACVSQIASMMEMSPPAISHHLRHLGDNGLVVSRRAGKEMYYHAADTSKSQLLHEMTEQIMAIACPELEGWTNGKPE